MNITGHEPDALRTLTDERLAELLADLAQLERGVADIRSGVSAPERCEDLLGALCNLRDGVERFAFALISSELDALSLDTSHDFASAREAIHRLHSALQSAIR